MEKSMVRMVDLVTGMIEGGQLTPEDEASLRELLVERANAQEGMSLAGYIEREADKSLDIKVDWLREMQTRVCRYCIRGSSIGEKKPGELTKDDIHKYIVHTAVSYEMDRNSWFLFLTMLQQALDVMSREGVLSFCPPSAMGWSFLEHDNKKHRIERPYYGLEWRKIRDWLEQNPQDVCGLALALWFAGGISPGEITELRKSCLMDSDGEYSTDPSVLRKSGWEEYLKLTRKRSLIIHAALDMYPGVDREYIFMIEGKRKLRKLPKTAMKEKLESICREVGVTYKPFKCSDMILWGLH